MEDGIKGFFKVALSNVTCFTSLGTGTSIGQDLGGLIRDIKPSWRWRRWWMPTPIKRSITRQKLMFPFEKVMNLFVMNVIAGAEETYRIPPRYSTNIDRKSKIQLDCAKKEIQFIHLSATTTTTNRLRQENNWPKDFEITKSRRNKKLHFLELSTVSDSMNKVFIKFRG